MRPPIPHRIAVAAVAATAAAALAGCGIPDPYAHRVVPRSTATTSATVTSAEPISERGGVIPRSAQTAPSASAPTPQSAIERYARLYMNWTARTVAAAQRRLAAMSVGGARAQALQAAASYQRDGTLLASHVQNAGTVVALAPGAGPAAGRWVVVTSETTTGQGDYAGLPPAIDVIYATVKRASGGWVIAEWSPRQ